MLRIKDFALERNVDKYAVAQYVRRHPEEFEGHTKIEKNQMYLDEEALEILDKKYPLPKPVQIIKGIPQEEHEELLHKFEESLKALEKVMQESQRKSEVIEQLQSDKLLLETATSQNEAIIKEKDINIAELQEKANMLDIQGKEKDEEIEALKRRAVEAELEADKLRARGFWARVFNKY